jgi:hypothetical protein
LVNIQHKRFWFTSDRNKIESGSLGLLVQVQLCQYIYLQVKSLVSEYDKLGLGQIEERGYDAIQ